MVPKATSKGHCSPSSFLVELESVPSERSLVARCQDSDDPLPLTAASAPPAPLHLHRKAAKDSRTYLPPTPTPSSLLLPPSLLPSLLPSLRSRLLTSEGVNFRLSGSRFDVWRSKVTIYQECGS